MYVENGSKNCSRTSTHITNKVVPMYAHPESHPRCLVYLLDTYLEKLPASAREKDIFYCRPAKIPNHSGVCYECAAVGKEKLHTFQASMCEEAGISKEKTNHSLRATGGTAMFAANVPEKIIHFVTGHGSSALQLYKHPAEEQQKSVSDLLVGGEQASPQSKPQSISQQPTTKSLQQQQSVSLTLQQPRAPFRQIQPVAAPIQASVDVLFPISSSMFTKPVLQLHNMRTVKSLTN